MQKRPTEKTKKKKKSKGLQREISRGEGGVDGVVEKVDGGEVREAAEDVGGEWAGEVGLGEVEGGDGGVGGGVAEDAGLGPARGGVAGVPRGEAGVRVVEGELELVEVEAFLVEGEDGGGWRCGENAEEEEHKRERHCC